MTDDPSMAGIYDDLIVIDAINFAGKLEVNDKIILNYGQIELTVTGFENKEDYKRKQQEHKIPKLDISKKLEESKQLFLNNQVDRASPRLSRRKTFGENADAMFKVPIAFHANTKLQEDPAIPAER